MLFSFSVHNEPVSVLTQKTASVKTLGFPLLVLERGLHTCTCVRSNHTNERVQFGKPILENQSVQHRVALAHAQATGAWQLALAAAEAHDRGDDIELIASSAKLLATELADEICSSLSPLFGGFGVTTSSRLGEIRGGIEVARVYEGAREVQLDLIFRNLRRLHKTGKFF